MPSSQAEIKSSIDLLRNARDLLDEAFHWHLTVEGDEYWANLWDVELPRVIEWLEEQLVENKKKKVKIESKVLPKDVFNA